MPADLLLPFGGSDAALPPLYCVHSASGSAYPYLPLAGLLDGRPVVGIEAPGYDGDGLPPADLRELADEYVRTVEEDCPERELCLLGWSMGGSVAFAMAQRLQARGYRVPLLVLVDAQAQDGGPVPSASRVLVRFATDLLTEAGLARPAALAAGVLGDLPPEAPTVTAWPLFHRAGLLPEELDAETLDHRFEVFRRNVTALHANRPEPGYPGRVLVVEASESAPGTLRWTDVAHDVRTVTVPGDHFSIWRGPGLTALGAAVRDALCEASAPRPEGAPA